LRRTFVGVEGQKFWVRAPDGRPTTPTSPTGWTGVNPDKEDDMVAAAAAIHAAQAGAKAERRKNKKNRTHTTEEEEVPVKRGKLGRMCDWIYSKKMPHQDKAKWFYEPACMSEVRGAGPWGANSSRCGGAEGGGGGGARG